MTAFTAVKQQTAPEESAPLIDRGQIDGLVAAAGVTGTRDILDAYWRSTDSLIAALRSQLEQACVEDAARTAHALKGCSLNVGATRFAETIRAIEEYCRHINAASALAQLDEAERFYADTARAFEALLAAAQQP